MCKCDVNRCHAGCCYNVPMTRSLISAYRKKIVTPIIFIEQIGEQMIIPHTSMIPQENKCPFLRDDFRCNIYVKRPEICRKFGDKNESNLFLKCGFLEGQGTSSMSIDGNAALLQTLDELMHGKWCSDNYK